MTTQLSKTHEQNWADTEVRGQTNSEVNTIDGVRIKETMIIPSNSEIIAMGHS